MVYDVSMRIIKETPLCRLAYKYGTGKCPMIRHNYTPYYYQYLKGKKDSIKKILEMGIGTSSFIKSANKTFDSRWIKKYQTGASLRMWRDFFPKAKIFGADISPDAMFKDEGIETFLCDETKEKDIKALIEKTGSDIDLFIDDASHVKEHQMYLAKTILPLLDKKVIYFIEDVGFPDHIINALKGYKCQVPVIEKFTPHTSKDRLILVRKA